MSGGTLIVRLVLIAFGLMILGGALLVSQGESSVPSLSGFLSLLA